jgi:hypothetical protein
MSVYSELGITTTPVDVDTRYELRLAQFRPLAEIVFA